MSKGIKFELQGTGQLKKGGIIYGPAQEAILYGRNAMYFSDWKKKGT